MSLTIRELARLAQVSNATVSLVLSGKSKGRVSEATAERITELARRHGYRSNLAAKGLAEGRTYRIAVCVEGTLVNHAMIGSFSLYERLGLFAQGMQEAGFAIEIFQIDKDLSVEETGRDLSVMGVDGFAFLSCKPDMARPLILSLGEAGLPAVASGTTLDGDDLTWTDIDRGASFREAVRMLSAEGHGEIALLDIEPGRFSEIKISAFLDAVRAEFGRDGREWMFTARAVTLPEAARVTREALDTMPHCRALLLTDNFYGEVALRVVREAGLRPGEDCRVVGFGDTALADRCSPKLSHYSLRVGEEAAFGLAALIDAIQSPADYAPRHIKFGPKYVLRET